MQPNWKMVIMKAKLGHSCVGLIRLLITGKRVEDEARKKMAEVLFAINTLLMIHFFFPKTNGFILYKK